MGIFDFIFGNNKKEEEARLERERQEKLKREREEKARIEAEKRRKEQESSSIEPFVFKSNCHQRYESGEPKLGLQECIRTIRVEKNTNGCSGYKLSPGKGYIVKIFNDDLGKPNMSDKPMRVVRRTADVVELRGFPIEAQTPFGWQKIDMSDYGLVVYYENGQVSKCVLHMYDRDTYIEYRQKKSPNIETIERKNTYSPIKNDVDNILSIYESGNVPLLQQKLFELCNKLNKPGSGKLITAYPEKDRLCEVYTLCLRYDWMKDRDIREVWAENAFYCISDYYLNHAKNIQDRFAAGIDFLWLYLSGKDGLMTKFNDIIHRAQFHPIHATMFSAANIRGGASHIIREFMWMAATEVQIVDRIRPDAITGWFRQEYEKALNNDEFKGTDKQDTIQKMNLMSSIIGSILEDF